MDNAGILKNFLVVKMVSVEAYREFSRKTKDTMLKSVLELLASNENTQIALLRRLIKKKGMASELEGLEQDLSVMRKKVNAIAASNDRERLEKTLECERMQKISFKKLAGPVKKFPFPELQEVLLLLAESEKLHEKMISEILEKTKKPVNA